MIESLARNGTRGHSFFCKDIGHGPSKGVGHLVQAPWTTRPSILDCGGMPLLSVRKALSPSLRAFIGEHQRSL
ncbi:MAG: hypothetical protein IJK42_11195 [Prevotella sp.]|nr:hypothetical protein [Prevotella sp.]MBQ6210316.1 hypothetical protein [Prevotella sp.]